jgi:hypothetical protein
LLNTIDWCMDLNHLKRPQSVFALQKALATWDRGEADPRRRAKTLKSTGWTACVARLSSLVGK